MLNDVAFVLCLDSLGLSDNLNLHVSKPPREDSAGGQFYKVQIIQHLLTFFVMWALIVMIAK